jgi:predicted secreted hydrolase
VRAWRYALAIAVLAGAAAPGPVRAQGAAVARPAARPSAPVSGYAQALTPRALAFPADEGPHPDYRQEWWYLTGNLAAADGERFGFELTIFRFALAPALHQRPSVSAASGGERSPWRTRQIYLAHFAVTDVARHRFRFAVRLARGALGLAGAQADPFRVWVENWRIGESATGRTAAIEPRSAEALWQVRAGGAGYDLALTARPLMPPVLNGEHGLSRKSAAPGDATYYYSMPRIAVAGTLTRGGRALPVRGLAWLDREWGSGGLGPQETGWDWFGLQLGDGSCLMFYSLRDRGGIQDPYSAGTWVDAQGHARPLSTAAVRVTALTHWTDATGVRYPSRWRLLVPELALDLTVSPVLADQELMTSPRYWEGAVQVTGTRGNRKVGGEGYVELVGYAGTTVGPAGIR